MASILNIFSYFLLFNFNGFFLLQKNFAQANLFHESEPANSLSTFFNPAPHQAINVFAKPIRDVIEATSKYNCFKPLTFYTALDETCLVNQTEKSLNARILNPITVATMTGGVLGEDLYELHEYLFYWQIGKCNVTHNLESRVYYFNLKYESFEKALDHTDGVAIINFPIATNGDIPNWKFTAFSKILQNKIKRPGDCTEVKTSFTYTWFVNFPYGSIYHTYKKQFVDSETGKKYTAVVIDLPLDPRINYISNQQFLNTFGKIKGLSEVFSSEDFVQGTSDAFKERQKGIHVLYLPA